MATLTSFSEMTALVIDDMSAQQTTLRGQLGMLGIGRVDVAGGIDDAVRQLRAKRYGLVLCDYHLNQKTDGQQLLEYLREQDLLPADCLFFMVTAESQYAKVAAVTEYRPDAYLLKPITAGDIEERLKTQLQRRQALLPVLQKIAAKQLPEALALCDEGLARKDRWYVQLLRLKGDVLLRLGRHEEARDLYRAALAERADLVWARLGLARALKAAGQHRQAADLGRELLASGDGELNIAAHDVLAEALEALGDARGAQAVLQEASQVVPSAKRRRLLGDVAYRNGDLDLATECFRKVAQSTRGSMTALPQDALALAQSLVDQGQAGEAMAALEDVNRTHRGNLGFEAVSQAIRAQAQARAGDLAGAAQSVQRARAAAGPARADFATVALAKAELMRGNEAAGMELLRGAISADHENPRIRQLVGKTLGDTGHAERFDELVAHAQAMVETKVKDARALFRDSRIDEALAAIETALAEMPENTGVLLQAAQMNCLALRLQKRRQPDLIERVDLYLSRLEKLLPDSDRVAQMQRYYRETLANLPA